MTRACGRYIDKCLGDSNDNGHGYLYKFRKGDQMFWLCRIMGRVWTGIPD